MKKLNKFFLITGISVILTRIWSTSLYYLFRSHPEVIQKIISDPFHHYHIGLILLATSYLFRRNSYSHTLSAVGLGIVLEEAPVMLGDIGLGTTAYYHSGYDLAIILTLVAISYLLFRNFLIATH